MVTVAASPSLALGETPPASMLLQPHQQGQQVAMPLSLLKDMEAKIAQLSAQISAPPPQDSSSSHSTTTTSWRRRDEVEVISDAQLETLESRLESLAAAQLLTDAELASLEDCVADGIEATATCERVTLEWVQCTQDASVGRLHKLIVLSEKIPKDAMFARQARRKFAKA